MTIQQFIQEAGKLRSDVSESLFHGKAVKRLKIINDKAVALRKRHEKGLITFSEYDKKTNRLFKSFEMEKKKLEGVM